MSNTRYSAWCSAADSRGERPVGEPGASTDSQCGHAPLFCSFALFHPECRGSCRGVSKELSGENKIQISGSRTSAKEAEKKHADHDPAAVDFLRRCDTQEQGLEIIDYLRSRDEIDDDYAASLKSQLLQKGIESFGTKKKPGHYFD